jgi:cation transport ATPase
MMAGAGVDLGALASEADRLGDQGATVVCVSPGKALLGLIAVVDPFKVSTPAALKALRARGLKTGMMSGDNRRTAESQSIARNQENRSESIACAEGRDREIAAGERRGRRQGR